MRETVSCCYCRLFLAKRHAKASLVSEDRMKTSHLQPCVSSLLFPGGRSVGLNDGKVTCWKVVIIGLRRPVGLCRMCRLFLTGQISRFDGTVASIKRASIISGRGGRGQSPTCLLYTSPSPRD